ncbi:stress responsive A/B barrel domain protein [Aspergillus uvarum CBS 121591]|uniref:Stress responsive A/B barrel domain protein n=1 Tax=Aspergillus uvarum CBS 121591 TaxID=1448315 RepID=A0A319CE20_9EURO|nr:stress responsive A/B barrel domain protein [Aspergillus uvarum CBS 121591]PYH76803.1 stress responsive A/B barrel domain protein [Aspergillus uvarum CBS 121591]
MGSVTHIVQLQFRKDVDAATVQDAIQRMLNLKEKCIHPETGKPYIVSSTGGKECSIEGMQDGITHVFVVVFASVADRDYYAQKDQAHLDYGASLLPIVEKVLVVDFAQNIY